jgi:Rieske Fe-S protein
MPQICLRFFGATSSQNRLENPKHYLTNGALAMSCHTCSRRDFLARSVVGVAGLAVIGNGCGSLAPPPLVEAVSSEDGKVRLALASYPDLALPGGAATLNVLGTTTQHNLLIVHPSADQWAAVDGICTHASCPLSYASKSQLIECSCHGSIFSLEGTVKHGPAKGALRVYQVALIDDILTIDISDGPPVTDGVLSVVVANYPDLAQAGGATLLTPRGLDDRLLVVRESDTAFTVTSSVCTHLGCDVGYNAKTAQLDCPCHGSIFATSGKVVQGPAAQALRSYPATFDGTTITVDVS